MALKLCSCFRTLDPDVTMRLTQLAHPVQRFLMPTCDLHLVILSSLQPLFMFETDNIIPLMADTHSNISTVFGLRHEMLDHMTCMYSVWISSAEVFFQVVFNLLPELCFLMKIQWPSQIPQWIWIPSFVNMDLDQLECMFCLVLQLKLYISDSARIREGLQQMFIHWDDAIRGIFWTH